MAFIEKPVISFTIALLVASMMVSSVNAEVDKFCALADDKVLCSQLVKHADDWPTAMTNLLQSSLEMTKKANTITGTIESKLPAELKPVSKESLDSTCKEAYNNIISNLKSGLTFVKDGDFGSLKSYLSAISFSDCTDSLNEFGTSLPEADQFQNDVKKLASTLLAVADEKNEKN